MDRLSSVYKRLSPSLGLQLGFPFPVGAASRVSLSHPSGKFLLPSIPPSWDGVVQTCAPPVWPLLLLLSSAVPCSLNSASCQESHCRSFRLCRSRVLTCSLPSCLHICILIVTILVLFFSDGLCCSVRTARWLGWIDCLRPCVSPMALSWWFGEWTCQTCAHGSYRRSGAI